MKNFTSTIIGTTFAISALLSTSGTALAADYVPTSDNLNKINIAQNLVSQNSINIIKVKDNYDEYTEFKTDGLYKTKETISGNTIDSKIYKIVNGEEILYSSIKSYIDGQTVKSTEYNYINGKTETSTLTAKISKIDDSKTQASNILTPQLSSYLGNSKTYLRTDKYGISLVGKKVTIGAVASAIIYIQKYVPISKAMIIAGAAATAPGGAIKYLPNYL